MKRLLLLIMILINSFAFSQKGKILIGALSGMDIHSGLSEARFYTSDLGKFKGELLPIWKDYKFDVSDEYVTFSKETVKIFYKVELGKVTEKSIVFEHFSDFNFYLSKFYEKTRPILENVDGINKYYFSESGNTVGFSTAFYAYKGKTEYDNIYKFYVNFILPEKK